MKFPLKYHEMVELLKMHNNRIKLDLPKSSKELERPLEQYIFHYYDNSIVTKHRFGGNTYSESKWHGQEWREIFIEDFIDWLKINHPVFLMMVKL